MGFEACVLEVVADADVRPRELRVLLRWDRAVPLKLAHLARPVLAAGGVLRADLDADDVRRRALATGLTVLRPLVRADLDALRRVAARALPTERALGRAAPAA